MIQKDLPSQHNLYVSMLSNNYVDIFYSIGYIGVFCILSVFYVLYILLLVFLFIINCALQHYRPFTALKKETQNTKNKNTQQTKKDTNKHNKQSTTFQLKQKNIQHYLINVSTSVIITAVVIF